MPITQDRVLALLTEHERTLQAARSAANAIERALTAYGDNPKELRTVISVYLAELRTLEDKYALLERERLGVRWKRNERLRDKAARKRRAKGIEARPERATIGANTPRLEADPDYFDEAEYERFNRGE
jgi:hypothetical protein